MGTVTTQARTIQIALPCLGEEEVAAVRGPLETGWLTQGPRVAAFEAAFAERHDVAHAIATTSCTTALHLALVIAGVGPGDEVIVPSFTWVATANAVLYCGATPVFADVDRATFNLDVADAAARVTNRTRAIIPVHLFGLCADMDGLMQVMPSDVCVIEDAACAAGASLNGVSVGGFGDFAAFSFHPRKTITTGEGGMLTTNDARLAAEAIVLRNHGASISEEQRHAGPKPYALPEFDELGFNYRMTDVQGAIGLAQLAKLDGFIAERRRRAAQYSTALAEIPWLRTPHVPDGYGHGWQAYVTYIDPDAAPAPRNVIMERLQARGISTRPGTHAVHMLGLYRDRFGLAPDDLPGARDCDANSMAIPLHNRMDDDDYDYVIKAIRDVV